MRSDGTQHRNIAAVHGAGAGTENSAVNLDKRPANPRRHKIRADGSTGAGTENITDDLMAGGWATTHSSKALRYTLVTIGFLLDMLLHIAVGAAVWYTFDHSPEPPWNPVMSGVFAGIAASFIHRTLIQRLIRTTLGKAFFGLRLRQEDGTYPPLRRLIKQWFIGILAALEIVTSLS
ncbi:RDD family protein [Nocardia sp. NPDC019395]|uniref:RDD family protein n=1 Tax=Nocardia sp. NPDC019395 TaxID=3154686 RepID=UPI0033E77B0C